MSKTRPGVPTTTCCGLQLAHVLADACAAYAGVALGAHVVSKGHHDLLYLLGQLSSWSKDQSLAVFDVGVDGLKDGDAECGGLAGSRLGLGYHVHALDTGHDGALLDGAGFLETVS